MKNHLKNLSPLTAAIFGGGIILRFVGLLSAPYWADEAWQIYTNHMTLPDLLNLQRIDIHPPLYYLLTWCVSHVFGDDVAMRALPFLFSVAGLWFIWLILQKTTLPLSAQNAGLAMAALLPFEQWQAQDGRVYALIGCLFAFGIWAAMERRPWLIFISQALLLWCHFTGAFYVAAVAMADLAFSISSAPTDIFEIGTEINGIPRSIWKIVRGAFIRSGAAVLCFLPWAPAIFTASTPTWMLGADPLSAVITSLATASFGYTLPWVAGLFCIAMMLLGGTQSNLKAFAFFGWAPLLLMAAVSIATGRLTIFYRIVGPGVPLLMAQTAALAWHGLAQRRWLQRGLLALTAATLIIPLAYTTPSLKTGSLREAAAYLNRHVEPGESVWHSTWTSYLPFSLLTEVDGAINPESGANVFKIPNQPLEDLSAPAWVIYSPDDVLLSEAVQAKIEQRLADGGAELHWEIITPQLPKIQIYHMEH